MECNWEAGQRQCGEIRNSVSFYGVKFGYDPLAQNYTFGAAASIYKDINCARLFHYLDDPSVIGGLHRTGAFPGASPGGYPPRPEVIQWLCAVLSGGDRER
ncbi:hypothetical protein MNKW57_13100 [Biformimicrobium ophioploci]|uniref:Uncharacterized protein n=1 Tax=Biformimicrobium ophioploci TaxID=3036711 RepID=A0ABQ6LY40_9GAMM|nr:hypothetical protein MNKW57_13100 [Microbulbifer sp. NKW57]